MRVSSWFAADDPERVPALCVLGADYSAGDLNHRRYDLRRLPELEDLAARVVIEWGSGTRSWSQWASRGTKPIIELRATTEDDAFPGFARFTSTTGEVEFLPESWRNALASVGGIYLLVHIKTGEQYVGSAYGERGFFGRWESYAANGHGGNKLLMAVTEREYSISILEVASPDMSASDIIGRENAWKQKLGSRAHGLNAN